MIDWPSFILGATGGAIFGGIATLWFVNRVMDEYYGRGRR